MKHDYQNILYCRIRLKELILPKSNSAFLKLRKSCKYCARPHPCEKYNYCPFDGQLEEDIEPKYSMKKAIEELKKYGITDVSQSLLKHYNNLGLINPRKTSKGHRRFSEYDLRGIVFIKLLTGINFKFKLDEIRYYLRVVMNKDIDVVEKIFGNIGFSNDDFLVDKRIDNYSRKGDQSLYWWTDSSQGQELLQKAETRMIQRTVWGYVYKNLEYDKDADILKYKMYLYPEKAEAHEAKIKRFLEFMHLYILFLCGRVDLYKIKDTLGAIDKFSLWLMTDTLVLIKS